MQLLRAHKAAWIAAGFLALSTAAALADPVTISFWNGFTSSDRPFVEKIVENFNASQTDVKVDMTIMPWDVFYQKLLPAFAAGQGPTIAAMDGSQLPGYAAKGVLAPLDALYASPDFPAAVLVPAGTQAGMYGGVHYGVPMAVSPTMMYWNKTLFAAAGLTEAPKTWDEWTDAAIKLTDVSGASDTRKYGIAIPDHAAIPQWAILLWGNGADVVAADGKTSTLGAPEAIATVDKWVKLIVDDKISPVGLGGVEGDNLFSSQRAAMVVNGPWASGAFKAAGVDFGIANVPAGPGGSVNNAVAVEMAVDAAASEEAKAAAATFMTYWNSVDAQVIFSETGFPATRTDVPVDQLKSETAREFAAGASAARFYLAGVVNFAQIHDTIVTPTIQRLTNGQGTAAELLPQAAQQIDPLLQ